MHNHGFPEKLDLQHRAEERKIEKNWKEEHFHEGVMVIIDCQIGRIKNSLGDNWAGLRCISRLDECGGKTNPNDELYSMI